MNIFLKYKWQRVPALRLFKRGRATKYTLIFLLAVYFSPALIAQPNITRLEYYVDADPGYGKATAINIAPAANLDNIPFTISLTPLSQGVHIVGIRSQDANGIWSLDNKWLFIKPYPVVKAAAARKIARLEYYIDVDPGRGNGTSIPIVPATSLSNIPFTIDMTSLAAGVHLAGIRSLDSTGAWSLDNKWVFLNNYTTKSAVALPKIERIEYYLDSDPGYGKGTSLNFVPNTNISNLALHIDLSSLNPGVHIVGIRSLDSTGAWSLDNKWIFLKPYSSKALPVPKIARVEYFIDSDPGYGNATALPMVPGTSLSNVPINIDITPLSAGVHLVGVRSQDSLGAWSLDNKWIFLKKYASIPAALQPNITNIEYYIDGDPGYGHATPVSIAAGTDLSGISFPASISSLAAGQHFLGIRSKDANGAWSIDNKYAFTITVHAGLVSGLQKITMDSLVNSLRLQYNPVHQQAVLLYTANKDDRVNVRVVDNSGKIVTTKLVNVYTGINPITLETGTLAQGIYIVQATGVKSMLSVKMLKQ